MAEMEPASRLVSLTDDELNKLHSKLHKSTDDNASVELHHLVTTEISRRGNDHGHHGDVWSTLEIEVDKAFNVDLATMSESLPLQDHDAFVKELGLTHGDVTVVLTIDGYEMRVDPSEVSKELNTEIASVEKTIREQNGKFTVYDATEQREFGTYDTLAQAKQRLRQIEYFAKSDNSFSPPEGVQSAAQRALQWIRDGKAGDGFTAVGRRRATQLATGDQVGLDTLVRMRSYFARHAVDKKATGFSSGEEGYPSAGRVAWDAWGGDAGRAWAESVLETELGKAYDPSEDLSDRQKALYAAIEGVASRFGAFDGSSFEAGAHYICADENVFASKGIKCANCVFYLGGGGCEIMDEPVEADAACKFWIIPDSLITESEDIVEDDGADIVDPVPLTLVTSDQLEKHGNHDQSVHGGKGGAVASESLKPKVPEAGITEAPPLSQEITDEIVGNWGKKNYSVFYGDSYESGSLDAQANKTLASVRAKTKLAERDKYVARLPEARSNPESYRHVTYQIAQLDGYIDGALGNKPKANVPWDTALRSGVRPNWFGQLADAFSKSEEDVEKHGDHDQSTHGHHGGLRDKSIPSDSLKQPLSSSSSDFPPIKAKSADPTKYSPEVIAAAKKRVDLATADEVRLSAEIQAVATLSGGVPAGTAHRLKSEDSLARKIDAEKHLHGGDIEATAASMSDVNRYTINFDEDKYTDGVTTAMADLESKGYKLRTKNYWSKGDAYQGINVGVTDPKTGREFELQFHTPRSFEVKNDPITGTHPLYEKFRVSSSNKERWKLWSSMTRMSNRIPVPKGADKIGGPSATRKQPFQLINPTTGEAGPPITETLDVYKGFVTGDKSVIHFQLEGGGVDGE